MTKATRPRYKSILFRDGLFERLDRLREEYPVIWISSHAGSGKTTLISSYVEQRKLGCLWYQCDEGDADLAAFFHRLGQAAPKRRASLPLFTAEYLQGVPAFTRRYFEELFRRLKVPSVLVFDNYQDVPEEAPLHEAILTALSRIPEGVNVVIVSRTAPPSAYIRLQANSHLGSLGWEALRFSKEEAEQIVALRSGATAVPETMRSLCGVCDGWAAGLILCAEAVKRETTIPSQTSAHVPEETFSYFMREIFSHLQPSEQHFFLSSAFLRRMTVAMAEALTGEPAAGNILRRMTRNNFFVSRHGGPEGGYAYHPLYRDFLLRHARQTLSSATLSQLQRSAATLLERAGETEAAVDLLMEAGDWNGMAGIILSHAPEMMRQGRYLSLRKWLDPLPCELAERNPWLLFWKGMSRLFLVPSQAKVLFEQAFTGFHAKADSPGTILAASWVIAAIVFSYEDFVSLDHWHAVLSGLTAGMDTFPGEEIEATVLSSLVLAAGFRDFPQPEVERLERRVLELAETESTSVLKMHALHLLFWRCLLFKGVREALPLLQAMQRLAQVHGAHQPLLALACLSAEAKFDLITGQHEALIQRADNLIGLSRHTGIQSESETAWPCLFAVNSCLNRMDWQGAQDWMAKMPSSEHWSPWTRFNHHNHSARLALVQGDVEQALAKGTQALALSREVGNGNTDALNHLMLSQICAHKGDRLTARDHLAHSRCYAQRTDCRFLLAMVCLVEAQFASDDGDEGRSAHLLRDGFFLARTGGYVLGFCDSPVLVLRLCERALEEGIEVPHVQMILSRRGLFPQTPPVHLVNWPWGIAIRTFGGFSLYRGDEPVTYSRKAQRKPLALLKALIALGGTEVLAERLAEALWPDADGDMAHQALEVALHRLRKLIGLPEAIIFREGRLSLNGRFCWVDAYAFEHLLALAGEADKQGGADRTHMLLAQADTLYRGVFLVEEGGEWWTTALATRLRSKHLQVAWRLGQLHDEQGQWVQAAHHYERCLEADECPEAIYRCLMVCYQHLGRSLEALEVYQRCRRMLTTTVNLLPSPETEAVRASIISGQ